MTTHWLEALNDRRGEVSFNDPPLFDEVETRGGIDRGEIPEGQLLTTG